MKSIETTKAPSAIGPYSQAVVSGGLLYLSGQIPIDPISGVIEVSALPKGALVEIEVIAEVG